MTNNPFKILFFALLPLNVLLRFFTNHLQIFPRVFNIIDIGIVLVLGVLSLFCRRRLGSNNLLKTAKQNLLIFTAVCFAGSILNFEYFFPHVFLSQLIMWVEPLLLFILISSYPFNFDEVKGYIKLLKYLLYLEIIIGIIQVPVYLKTGDSEAILGTFYHNAEQYQFFILFAVYFILAKIQLEKDGILKQYLIVLIIISLVILINNKASLISLGITLIAVFRLIWRIKNNKFILFKSFAIGFSMAVFGILVVSNISVQFKKFENFYEAWRTRNILNLGKIKAFRDIFSSFKEEPYRALVGCGLGIFYSRTSFQYFGFNPDYYAPEKSFFNESKKPREYRESDSMGGVIKRIKGKEPFYKRYFKYEVIYSLGSGTADYPTSSYVALLGETGLLGTILYLIIYWKTLRMLRYWARRLYENPMGWELAIATYGGFIYLLCMGSYNFWLETGRINTIIWSLVALCFHAANLQEGRSKEI